MDNPYAASHLSAEPATEGRKRRPVWKSLLIAYAVHHLASVLGLLAGLMVEPSQWERFFPPNDPWAALVMLVIVPVSDLYFLVEPLGAGDSVPYTFVALRVIRSALALTIAVAAVAYGRTHWRGWLWYVGIVSFFVYLSSVLTNAANDRLLLG